MAKKQLRIIILISVALNLIMLIFLVSSSISSSGKPREKVATVGKEKITRQEWMLELEKQYGEEVLKQLVDREIINQIAKDYDVEISEEDFEKEVLMLKALYHTNGNSVDGDWQDELRTSILLEEVLTKDVGVPDEELKQYYEANKDQYLIKPGLNLSQIVVATEEEANQVMQELEDGASFSTLARELSIDEFSANQGGEIGLIDEDDSRLTEQHLAVIADLAKGDHGPAFETMDGFVILKVTDRLEGLNFTYDEIKNHLRRKIALSQMEIPLSTKPFWEELKVNWYYDKTE